MRILFIGDIVGRPGRETASDLIPGLRYELSPDMVIANAENAAGGFGLTKDTARELLNSGIDVITLGNHAFAKRESWKELEDEPRILRPANFPPGVPGIGWCTYETPDRKTIAVVNLQGRVFMAALDCPFRTADAVLDEAAQRTNVILIDMHAEATSEKMAMGWYLDGRASAVIGTHTHIQTADEHVMPQGTAYISDAGMTGVVESVLGMDRECVIERFRTQVSGRLRPASGASELQGVLVTIDDETGNAVEITRIKRPSGDRKAGE